MLLSVPVKCLVAAKQATGKVLGDLVVGSTLTLFALLKALEIRNSVHFMLFSVLLRAFVMVFSICIAIQGVRMMLSYVISEDLPLYMSIPTVLTLFVTLFNITRKRIAAKEIPSFTPILILALLDLFSLLLTLVSLLFSCFLLHFSAFIAIIRCKNAF